MRLILNTYLRIILFFRLLAFNVACLCKKTTQKQTSLRKLDEKKINALAQAYNEADLKETYFAV